MSVIHLTDVSFVRNGKYILNNINWIVEPGERWVLMGLNGSGKSSLLSIVQGQNWPTTGTVQVLGETFGKTRMPDLQKRIGWVGSILNAKLNQYDTVDRIILSGYFSSIGIYKKYGESELELVQSIMQRLGIEHLTGRQYITCSQGQQQLILIARALIADPEILILDEPCNALDLFATEAILKSIAQLTKDPQGPTILYVTHHAHHIIPEFDHTLLLKNGEIFSQGQTTDILTSQQLSDFYSHSVDVSPMANERFMVTVTP